MIQQEQTLLVMLVEKVRKSQFEHQDQNRGTPLVARSRGKTKIQRLCCI
jgi:hypothetical protein